MQAHEPETGDPDAPEFRDFLTFCSESSGPVITPLHPQAPGTRARCSGPKEYVQKAVLRQSAFVVVALIFLRGPFEPLAQQ